ncbi:Sensor histidine kinase RcsC [Dyadobacter sp. CECT 9275]|uniref:histidine kinase n=1 Tax=Dyadobacter helix TaxID=2822344 RepID=A0A916JFN1_9BACT|nr:response regulator [Dyadobacter sp. CECT 9275]CAG5012064.1 Sensor histidine kinase RcsC [Dyadobacter sp. CECT 9275]
MRDNIVDALITSDNIDALWEKEIEARSLWGHRVFCLAFILGYPAATSLYYLNNNPYFLWIFSISLLASFSLLILQIWHWRHKINGREVSFYSQLAILFFHAYILATVPHLSYERANVNMTFALIFLVLVTKWPVRYAVISSAVVLILFPVALYSLSPEALSLYYKEGGLFFFLGYLLFPFIARHRYNADYKEFIYKSSLRLQNEALENQNVLIQQATEAKSGFLATMSHEIRTPLNGIVGIVHLLQHDQAVDQEQKELFRTLKFSADHLMAVVNNVLDFSKISSKHVELDRSAFDLRLLLGNLKKTFIPRITEKQISLIFDVADNIPATLLGDEIRLSQIITNLIHNAIKFTDVGFVRLMVRAESKNAETVRVYFEVSDSGVGISPDEQEKVFELFRQAHSQNNKITAGGTGLGLAITKELLHLHGSEIHLISELGKGSIFSFEIEFPFLKEEIMRSIVMNETTSISMVGKKVLIVDDNQTNLLIAGTLLKRRNIAFDTAKDGQEALEKFQSATYEVILMDLRMPVMDGFEATLRIREIDKHIPVIALSASAFEEEKEMALSGGFSGYLVKPFLPEELYDIMQSSFERMSSTPAK